MRRKLRFFLTSFGIAIGAAAIIVLVSFGAGLQKTNDDLMKDFSQLEEIFVTGANYDSAGMGIATVNTIDKLKEKPLNDKTMDQFKKIPGVKDAYAQARFPLKRRLTEKRRNSMLPNHRHWNMLKNPQWRGLSMAIFYFG